MREASGRLKAAESLPHCRSIVSGESSRLRGMGIFARPPPASKLMTMWEGGVFGQPNNVS